MIFWKILLGLCAITFIIGGIDLATKAGSACEHVTWGHEGSARYGSFAYTCWSDSEWANRDEYVVLDSGGNETSASDGGAMSGVLAAALAFGIAAIALVLASWPLLPNLTWRRDEFAGPASEGW